MDTLTDRITEAEACRVQFLKSLEEVRNKLTGPQLTVEAMSLLAKGLDVPEQVKAAAKQNPFFTSAILAFSAFILSGAFKTSVHKKRSSMTSKTN